MLVYCCRCLDVLVVWSVCVDHDCKLCKKKVAEPTEMLFVLWTQMDPSYHVLHGIHMGATGQVRLNDPCLAVLQTVTTVTSQRINSGFVI